MISIRFSSVALIMACVLGAVCFHVGTAAQKEAAQAADKLDGTWYVVRQEKFGNVVPPIVAKRMTLVIDGDKMEWYIGNPAPNQAAIFTLDPEKKAIDAKVTRGSLNTRTMLGIYKIEDGMLHVCWAEIDAKRPTKFATTKPGGGSVEYAIYSRTKDQELKNQPGKEATGPGKKDIRTLQVKLAEKWID